MLTSDHEAQLELTFLSAPCHFPHTIHGRSIPDPNLCGRLQHAIHVAYRSGWYGSKAVELKTLDPYFQDRFSMVWIESFSIEKVRSIPLKQQGFGSHARSIPRSKPH